MFATQNRADNVRRQYRETEEPRRVGRYDALRFGNILKRQDSIREKLVADCVGTDEETHKASIGSCGLRPIIDDDPHLLAGASEVSRNRPRCHLAIGLGSGYLDRLGWLGRLVKAPKDAILIHHDINAVHMDLDAHDAGAHKCSEGFRPAVMVSRGKICRLPDQPLLGYGVGSGMLNGRKDGGRIGKPVANAPDDQRFKGGRRDSLAPGFGVRRPFQQRPRDVVAVTGAFLVRMRRAHPTALRIEQNPRQQVWLMAGLSIGSVNAVLRQDGLDIVPKRLVDDGLMLAWIALALVDDFTPINPVLQHQVERTAGDRLAAVLAAVGRRPDLADNAEGIEVLLQFPD